MEETINQMTRWLQQQVQHAGAKGLLVGVSGGLDSAVVAFLIKRAFPDNSLGVIMPLHSNPSDVRDAQAVLEKANLKQLTVELTASHQLLYKGIEDELRRTRDWQEEQNRIADANLRARLRMSTLYTIATQKQYLVTGTDNAAEWFTGYFTKFGDGGVDLQPIIQLTKAEVGQMAAFLGVPRSVIDKQPSADLWEGQTDEDEMGTSYAHIDAYVSGESIPEADKVRIEQMHKRTAHKRNIATQFIFR